MNRRRVLHAGSIVLGSALAGCVDGAVGANEQTGSESPTNSEAGTNTTSGTANELNNSESPTTEMAIELTIENRDTRSHTVSIRVVHEQEAKCLYNEVDTCDVPVQRSVALDEKYDIKPSGEKTLKKIKTNLEDGEKDNDNDIVDKYIIRIETNTGQQAQLLGLETGAASIVDRNYAGKHPWRVAGRKYHIKAILTSEMVELALSSVE